MGQRLENKVALVTGAGSGFGEGIASRFASEGARVVVADINLEAANRVVTQLKANSLGSATACEVDVANSESVAAAVAQTLAAHQHIDILVNNAGLALSPTAMEDITEAQFEQVLAVNAKSIFLFAKYLVPHMKTRNQGVILNIASTAGVSPRPNLTWYNASKGWVITATKSMAVELAPNNIRVNALNPVAGATPMLATFMGEDTEQARQRFLSTIPLGRFSTPQDVADAACFLCSDEASLITGVALEIDGGRCI